MIALPTQISLLLALLASPVLVLAHITLIRFSRQGKVRLMMGAFFIYAALWGFVSAYAIGGNPLAWIISGGLLVGFLCLGYAEFFSMVSRGFSLQILVDVYRHKTVLLEQLLEGYGGKGMHWMIEKRIRSLELLGMMGRRGDTLFLKKFGVIVGQAGIIVKQILNLGKGG